GTPARAYAQKLSSTPTRLALSATMRLATDATRVRLPASVEAIASTSADSVGVTGNNSNTAGTLLTTFESAAVTHTRSRRPPVPNAPSSHRCGAPVAAMAPTTTNRPANKTSTPKSIWRSKPRAAAPRETNSTAPAVTAATATGTPTAKATNRATAASTPMTNGPRGSRGHGGGRGVAAAGAGIARSRRNMTRSTPKVTATARMATGPRIRRNSP